VTKKLARVFRIAINVVMIPVCWLLARALFMPLPDELRTHEYDESVTFTDRDGAVLREIRANDATRARWVPLADAGPWVPVAIVAAEDARFEHHPGVDPLAVVRALGQAIRSWHVVSGASTLTMQLARIMRPHPKSAAGKFDEMALALRIEASLSKDAILEQYMNRAPFGPQIRGVDAASRYYFDKPSSALSLAESATLAAIPRGPTLYDPAKHPDNVRRRRDRILDRMLGARAISQEEHDVAIAEPLVRVPAKGSFGAPHFVQALYNGTLDGHPRSGPIVKTTLERDLQRAAEEAVLVGLAGLSSKHATQGSVIVVDNATGDVLAYVGSASYDDPRDGQNDGVRQKRQPGSTLKPFVYELAFERGLIDAATTIDDIETAIPIEGGTWAPHNYDEHFHGPVRAREALANSLNVPAVRVLERAGEEQMLVRLHTLGFASLDRDAAFYGPGLALGDGEVTLLELARAYSTIARGGVDMPLRFTMEEPSPRARVMAVQSADLVADILADRDARLASFGERSVLELPFRVAAKTGTSKGFRDNWTIGFTREITVGVWVGNFDGSAMSSVSGITGAGPIFGAVMTAAMHGRTPAPLGVHENEGLVRTKVCPLSGKLLTHACPHAVDEWLPSGPRESCPMHDMVAIDTRNQLRAGPGCSSKFVALKSFERFDGELAAWAKGAHRSMAPSEFSPLCPGPKSAPSGSVAISYPPDGTRFVIDPGLAASLQVVDVRIGGPSGATIQLLVDGRPISAHDGTAHWPLTPGSHVLVARADGLTPSTAIHVDVSR
jgi:penicillin-binding protein 1C